jgi:glycosyltransferase involved in cell wall biosynthesis
MRVHFLIPGDINQLTGGYIYNRKMIEGLVSKGHEVEVHNPGSDFPFPGKESLGNCRRIFSSIGRGEPIVIDSLALGPCEKIIVQFAGNNPMVGLIHLPLFMNPSFTQIEKSVFKAQESRAYKKMRFLIAVSMHTRQLIHECGIDNSSIFVVHPQAESPTRKTFYPSLPHNLLCIANYTRNKGHSTLITALAGLKSFDWVLSCYGDQTMEIEYALKLIKEVKELGLDDRISLNGPLQHQSLTEIYLQADLFILPSEYESYPMVLVESLVHGIPVIAAEAGGIPELVPDGTGYFFEPGNAGSLEKVIQKLLTQVDLYKSMSRKAAVSYTFFRPWKQSIDRFEQILHRNL